MNTTLAQAVLIYTVAYIQFTEEMHKIQTGHPAFFKLMIIKFTVCIYFLLLTDVCKASPF